MFERFTTELRTVVMTAAQEATVRRGEARIGTDHLLIGVVSAGNPAASAAGLTVEALHATLDQLDVQALGVVGLDAGNAALAPSPGPARRGHLPFTRGARKALVRSLRVAIDLGHRRIGTDHLLAGLMVGGPRDRAVRLVRAAGVEPAELEAAVRQALRRQAS